MNIDILKTEITTDPLTRGYSGMSDEAAAVDLNTVYRTRNKAIMTATEIFNAVDKTELSNLSVAKEQRMYRLLSFGELNPFGLEVDVFIDIFGAGSTTITTLQVLRKDDVSRGIELGIGIVRVGNVMEARL